MAHRLPLGGKSQIPVMGYGVGTAHFKREIFKGVDTNAASTPLCAEVQQAVEAALKAGFRHIDAAEVYGTERETGHAMKAVLAQMPGLSRTDFFVTTKIWQGLDNTAMAVQGCLHRLGLSYVDLVLVHTPFKPGVDYRQVWAALEQLVDQGVVRCIGCSNYSVAMLQELLQYARIRPVANQVEAHPHLQQLELRDFCRAEGIQLLAYSPQAPLTTEPCADSQPLLDLLSAVAQVHGVTPGQVLLRWSLQRGYVPITTSTKAARMAEALAAALAPPPASPLGPAALHGCTDGFTLSGEEVQRICAVGAQYRLRKFFKAEHEALGL